MNLNIQVTDKIDGNWKYRNMIETLLYITNGARPGISFAANFLSQLQYSHNSTHFRHAWRVLNYIFETRSIKLIYSSDAHEIMDVSVDADYAAGITSRKSATGIMLRVFGNVVQWKS